MLARWCAVLVMVAACGGPSGVGSLRFANQAPVWQVNDRVHTPTPPKENKFARLLYFFDGAFTQPVGNAMEIRRAKPVADVNSLGEVPDSTWFTNRIGIRDLSVDEIRFGPNRGGNPEANKPWTVLGTKVGGVSVGFTIKDSKGNRYLLKFDAKGFPEMETAADVIVQRLLWACGFNVPEDTIVYFNRGDLKLSPKASVKDPLGNKRKMTVKDLEENLAKVEIEPDGRIRGLVSKWLSGKPVGGFSIEGVRKDDPNDKIAHERRRSVRGSAAIFAWLNHTDIKEDNTLDMWVKDPKNPKVRYLMHYQVDFGKALGVLGYMDGLAFEGFSPVFGVGNVIKSLFTVGLWKRPWDEIRSPNMRGIALFESARYHPAGWMAHANYLPFSDRDRFDEFWGAKILIRFSRAQIRAAVEQGRLSEKRSVDYMVDTLVVRQRKTARYWFSKVAPLDRFKISDKGALCFEDLSVRYKLGATAKGTSYQARFFDHSGRMLRGGGTPSITASGAGCIKDINHGRANGDYTIVRIDTRRNGSSMGLPVYVHLARDKDSGRLRVIGLDRR